MEPKDEDKLVVFGEYANEAEASIVKGVLETNGIPCILTNELLSSLLPMAPLKAGLVRLMVFDFDLEMAKKYALPYLLIDKEYKIDTDNLL